MERTGKRTAAWLGALVVAAWIGLAAGCGYAPASGSSAENTLAIEPRFRRLNLVKVENPTTEPRVEARLRSILRDELTRRGGVEWVERGQARGLLRVRIQQFTNSAKVKDADDVTVKYQVVVSLSARITNPDDNAVLWDSGLITAEESYFPSQNVREAAEERALDLAARQLADRLGDAF